MLRIHGVIGSGIFTQRYSATHVDLSGRGIVGQNPACSRTAAIISDKSPTRRIVLI